MGKKKNKKGKQKKQQKQFWNMDMLKRVLPTVVAASLDGILEKAGVEAICYDTSITTEVISVRRQLPVVWP